MSEQWSSQLAHWGAYEARTNGYEILSVRADGRDRDPSDILQNIPGMITDPSRATSRPPRATPRYGALLESGHGPSTRRGSEPFVDVEWAVALDLLARDLERVGQACGPQGIYGGSYGWASAGRFHHAQSQIHRFLNCLGGFTRSVNSYSFGASEVIMPHVAGPMMELYQGSTTWDVVKGHSADGRLRRCVPKELCRVFRWNSPPHGQPEPS